MKKLNYSVLMSVYFKEKSEYLEKSMKNKGLEYALNYVLGKYQNNLINR